MPNKLFKQLVQILMIVAFGFMVAKGFACPPQDKDEYLFIQTAHSGAFTYNKDHQFILTLYEVDPWVTYFSNVPKRVTGFMTTEAFLKIFNKTHSHPANGLNAGLVLLDKNHGINHYIVTLKHPSYHAGTLTYDAILVPGNQKDDLKNIQFNHAELFIDSACASCGASGF